MNLKSGYKKLNKKEANQKIDIDWPNVSVKYVTFRDLDRMNAIKNLIKGAAATIFSTCMFTFLIMLIVMTPDPNGTINYNLVGGILIIFVAMFIYGLFKLNFVEEFLKRGNQKWERHTR